LQLLPLGWHWQVASIARQAGAAVHALRLTNDLQRSRQQQWQNCWKTCCCHWIAVGTTNHYQK
jgi:hypothetical protein